MYIYQTVCISVYKYTYPLSAEALSTAAPAWRQWKPQGSLFWKGASRCCFPSSDRIPSPRKLSLALPRDLCRNLPDTPGDLLNRPKKKRKKKSRMQKRRREGAAPDLRLGRDARFSTWQASPPPLSGPAHRTVMAGWGLLALRLPCQRFTVWRTYLHLAGLTRSSWTSLNTAGRRPSGKERVTHQTLK